jgi:predicted transposase/invertase (TIGR01784 family)
MGTEQIHDAFARKENAAFFFRNILPENISKKLKFDSLKQETGSYIDDSLQTYFSDVVYSCRYAGSAVKIALLFEHKSSVPQFPHLQLLRYILNIWESCRKQRQPVSIVLPIILYHGKRVWKKRPLKDYLSGKTELLNNFIPDFDYLLVDLSNFQDAKIMLLFKDNPAVKLWLLIQKYVYSSQSLVEKLDSFFSSDILYFTTEEGLRVLERICWYVFKATTIDAETVFRTVTVLSEAAKETIMTTAEKLIKEGEQKAKIEDARKMLAKGYPIDDICEITGLSREEVEKLKSRES